MINADIILQIGPCVLAAAVQLNRSSAVVAYIIDHLAILRQAAHRHQLDVAAQFGQLADSSDNGVYLAIVLRVFDFAMQSHFIVGHAPRYHQPRFSDLWMAARDFMYLRRVHEHGAHLGGLVGTPHPALDTRIRASARRVMNTQQHGRQVTGGETDQWIIGIEDGDHHFAHFAGCDGYAAARVDEYA